jgi:hypothetical protein
MWRGGQGRNGWKMHKQPKQESQEEDEAIEAMETEDIYGFKLKLLMCILVGEEFHRDGPVSGVTPACRKPFCST